MKPLLTLDHVMVWVARATILIVCLLLARMIHLAPAFAEPVWRTLGRELLFAGSIAAFFGLFQLHSAGVRFFLMSYSVTFLFVVVASALADRIDIYNTFQQGQHLNFHEFWDSVFADILHPFLIPLLTPLTVFWVALRPHPQRFPGTLRAVTWS